MGCVTSTKDKNHMIILIDAGKAFDKIQHQFMIKKKNPYEGGYRGNISQYNKTYSWQPTTNVILNSEKLKAFLLISGTRQRCSLSPLLFKQVLEVLTTAIRQEKEIKGIQMDREEVKLPLYRDDMILYIENTQVSTQKLLESLGLANANYYI